jgi:hypothetical protein
MEAHMNFYYNIQINVCAEENWVVDYLIENGYCENKEEALQGLRSCREFYGWVDCEVSNTIEELISVHYGVW